MLDTVGRVGNWDNNAAYIDVDTQAPAVSPPSGLTGGGLDDRFDWQMATFTDHLPVMADYVVAGVGAADVPESGMATIIVFSGEALLCATRRPRHCLTDRNAL